MVFYTHMAYNANQEALINIFKKGGPNMDNELRKTLDVKLNINIDGTAAFGIVLASIAGLCFCFYTDTKSRYSAQIGTVNFSPAPSAVVSV